MFSLKFNSLKKLFIKNSNLNFQKLLQKNFINNFNFSHLKKKK